MIGFNTDILMFKGEMAKQIADTEEILKLAKGKPDKKKLWEVAKQMEGMFLNMVLKALRKTVPESQGIFQKTFAEKMFEDMLYERYALNIAKLSDFGIAKMIYDTYKDFI